MTYLYERVSADDVVDRARAFDRLSQFGCDGWRDLHAYLEELAEDTGVPAELDIIALCCDFIRFEDIADYNEQYSTDHSAPEDIEELALIVGDGPAFICYAH